MIHFRTAQEVASYISLFLGYLIAIAPAGWFKAWVARFMGDDTAEQQGLLTLNPFAHISFSGIVFLLLPFFRVGWGQDIPVNAYAIHGKHHNLRLALTLFSNTFMHWLVATLSLVVLIGIWGPEWGSKMLLTYNSSLNIAYTHVFLECIRLSIFLALVSFIINGITYFVTVHRPDLDQEPLAGWYYVFAYLIIAFVLGSDISRSMMHASIIVGQWLAHLFGVGGV